MALAELADRVSDLASTLTEPERSDAKRMVELCRVVAAGNLVDEDLSVRRELGRLVELLARRSAQAVPAATLGRCALAQLAGDERQVVELSRECDVRLSMAGL